MKGYARIYRRLWEDIRHLEVPDQLLVLYLLGKPSNRVGVYRVSVGDAAEQFRDRTPIEIQEAIARVAGVMGWSWDLRLRVLSVPSWWAWNKPESPSALKGYLKDLRDVPDGELRRQATTCPEWFPEAMKQAWAEGLEAAGLSYARQAPPQAPPETTTASPPIRGEAPPENRGGSRARAPVGPKPKPEPKPEKRDGSSSLRSEERDGSADAPLSENPTPAPNGIDLVQALADAKALPPTPRSTAPPPFPCDQLWAQVKELSLDAIRRRSLMQVAGWLWNGGTHDPDLIAAALGEISRAKNPFAYFREGSQALETMRSRLAGQRATRDSAELRKADAAAGLRPRGP